MKYIDAEKLKEKIYAEDTVSLAHGSLPEFDQGCHYAFLTVLSFIDSLQQEQFNDVRAEIKEYYGEDLAFEDERAKAAYHFFSSGKAFELREYEEERKRHITDLLDAAQKGMKAGYEKAISELKEGKVECSPVMKELIDKLFGIGNTFNFGFGPKNIQQEQLPGIEEHGIPGKDFIPVEWVDACEKYGKWKIVQQEQPDNWNDEYQEDELLTRFAFYTYKDEESVLYLSNLFVEKTSRNKGIGTKILQAAEKVAETIGAISICLKVKQNSPANAWYRKRGYGYCTFEGEYDWLEKKLEYLKPKQGQPEVDFKIEERKWVHDAVDNIFPEDGDFMSEVDFRKILKGTARHFYELGLNARKEE